MHRSLLEARISGWGGIGHAWRDIPLVGFKPLRPPVWCPHSHPRRLSPPPCRYLEDGSPSDSSLYCPLHHSHSAPAGALSQDVTAHPAATVPGSTPLRGLALGCLFPSRAERVSIPKKIGRFHRPLRTLARSGRIYRFPVETGPGCWAPCPAPKQGLLIAEHGGLLFPACQWFDENRPCNRECESQNQPAGVKSDTCTAACDPAGVGLMGGRARAGT